MAPLTAGWDDILGPLGIDTSDIPDTRLSVQGGGAWFNQQDAGTQRSILGPAKYTAYKAGDLDLEDLLGQGDDGIFERTLKSLGLNAQDYL